MASNTAIVPEGMSYVNAWYALYRGANQRGGFLENNPEKWTGLEELVSTSAKVADLFKNYPTNRFPLYYMEYEGGRRMKVHFCDFPKLDVYDYDASYGQGAAQRILDYYNETASENRFDESDSYQFSELRRQ